MIKEKIFISVERRDVKLQSIILKMFIQVLTLLLKYEKNYQV